MVAVYPSAIKSFAYRQDYTELVEAADVNTAYDEIRAIQTTLGANPNKETIDGTTYSWNTVSDRISSIRTGLSKPYVSVANHNFAIPYQTRQTVSFTTRTFDTNHIWAGGSTLVCPRSGVYTFDIYMRWHSDAFPSDNQQIPFNRGGELYIELTPVGGTANIVNQGGYFPQGWQHATHQSASITALWSKGTAVEMHAYQNCMTTGLFGTATCAITYHRDPPGLPFSPTTIIGL